MKSGKERGKGAGKKMAMAIIEWGNLFYNLGTRQRVLEAVHVRLGRELKRLQKERK